MQKWAEFDHVCAVFGGKFDHIWPSFPPKTDQIWTNSCSISTLFSASPFFLFLIWQSENHNYELRFKAI